MWLTIFITKSKLLKVSQVNIKAVLFKNIIYINNLY